MPQELLTLKQLESFIWEGANLLRGSMDALEFKHHLFGLIFLKRLSDTFSKTEQSETEDSICIPFEASWEFFINVKDKVGESIDKGTELIEKHNPSLRGILSSVKFNRIDDKRLKLLLNHFSKRSFNEASFERPDLMGAVYEYLLKTFAESAGKGGGEFFTPPCLVKLMSHILSVKEGMTVLDPTCGSGGMFIGIKNCLDKAGLDYKKVKFFGQDSNFNSWSICNLNLIVHGFKGFDVRNGDTLSNPQHTEDGKLKTFDRVIANPPFSLKNWGKDLAEEDKYKRYRYGIPPKGAGDLAFVQHMIASLNEKGVMGVVVPHGVLFRGGQEGEIRKGILEDDLIEAVIGLPSGLFYGTGIPAALLVINKNKAFERRGKVLFINAELDYQEGKNQNILRDQDIEKVVGCFDAYNDIKRFSRVVPIVEIRENDHNLNIRRYVDTSPPPEPFDVRGILHGGVPIKEVESEYIRDILEGYDVSVVLEPKDGEYLKFRDDIKEKSQIRQYLGDASDAMNQQFERWWDKYGVSLAQIDAEVKEAEAVMHGFLKELGYE